MENLPEFVEPDEPFSQAQIASLQALVEPDLPEDYVSFLTSHGAGLFPMDGMVVEVAWQRADGGSVGEDDDDFEDLDSKHPFFSLWDADQIEEQLESIRRQRATVGQIVPAHWFPIGDDSGGAEYWIDLLSDKPGSIWIRHSNFDYPWGEGSNQFIGFVADNFEDLIFNRLKPLPEGW